MNPPLYSHPVAPPPPAAGVFRAFVGRKYPLGDGRELVVCPVTGATAAVTAHDPQLLAGCKSFQTIPEHARRLAASLKQPGREAIIAARLTALAAAGVLVSPGQLETLARAATPGGPARVGVVAVPTRDRPDLLARCLTDFADAAPGRDFELVVADDSPTDAGRAATRAVLDRLRGRFPGPVRHVTRPDRAAYAAALADAGADAEAARFALTPGDDYGVTVGANRNLLLLHAAGRVLLQVDDDVRCRTVSPPGAGGGLVLTSKADPMSMWLPPDVPDPATALGPPADLLARHERLLGRGLGDALAALPAGDSPDVLGLEAAFFRRLRAGGGRVRVTALGLAGDPATSSPIAFVMTHQGPFAGRLHRDEATYRAALARCPLLRAATRPTVSNASSCMGLNLGVDLRTPLPPFLPVLRGEDAVFGLLVEQCCPGALFGHLPEAVWHLPAEARGFSPTALDDQAGGLDAVALLVHAVRTLHTKFPGADEGANLRSLGETLAALGSLPVPEFRDVVRGWVLEWATLLLGQLPGMVRAYQAARPWWAADARRLADRLRREVLAPDFGSPPDLWDGPDRGPGFGRFRRLVASVGRLLTHWPALTDAAIALRAKGVTPGELVG